MTELNINYETFTAADAVNIMYGVDKNTLDQAKPIFDRIIDISRNINKKMDIKHRIYVGEKKPNNISNSKWIPNNRKYDIEVDKLDIKLMILFLSRGFTVKNIGLNYCKSFLGRAAIYTLDFNFENQNDDDDKHYQKVWKIKW